MKAVLAIEPNAPPIESSPVFGKAKQLAWGPTGHGDPRHLVPLPDELVLSTRGKNLRFIAEAAREQGLEIVEQGVTANNHIRVVALAADGRAKLFIFGASDSDPRRGKHFCADLRRFRHGIEADAQNAAARQLHRRTRAGKRS